MQHPILGYSPNNGVIIRQASQADIPLIRKLAQAIWPICYQHIISKEQIEYMLNLFYSEEALVDQFIIKKHRFLILEMVGIPSGFASFSEKSHSEKTIFRLHKIYLLPALQGKGFGQKLFEEVEQNAINNGALQLELNVNRNNSAISFYQKSGFKILCEKDLDIGQGFFMNDFIMIKNLVTRAVDGFA